jgi:hypothetical protein
MPGKAATVVITEQQQDILQQMTRSRSCPQGLCPDMRQKPSWCRAIPSHRLEGRVRRRMPSLRHGIETANDRTLNWLTQRI